MNLQISNAQLRIDIEGHLTIRIKPDKGRVHVAYEKIDPPRCGEYSEETLMRDALSFLSACGESVGYAMRHAGKGENVDLFDPIVGMWAYCNNGEIQWKEIELEGIES